MTVVIIVAALLIAILASVAVTEGLMNKDSICQSCGRHLNQTTTCKDHDHVCCVCHGHELWD